MGKSSLCLQMLQLLNTGRIYKCSELADILETNSRNIIEYKKELEEAGYYITSIPGKYGGYKLEKTGLIPSIKLLDSESKSIAEAYDYVLKKKDFIFKKEFQLGMSKFFSETGISTNSNLLIVDKTISLTSEEEIKNRYLLLETAINKRTSVEISYFNNFIEINPYKLFIYDNDWSLMAWTPSVGDIKVYKLENIKEIKQINKKFIVHKYFDPNKYYEGCGLVSSEEFYEVKLIASNDAIELFENKIIGRKQQTNLISKNKLEVSLELQNKEKIISFILGLGLNVKVLEPQWLKKEIINISKKLILKYEKE